MLARSPLAVLLGLVVLGTGLLPSGARAYDERDVVYEAGRNKIGLLRYCRDQTLLDSARANSAASAVEAGIAGFAPQDFLARERGERAERAGEAGFWEANGKRDLANLAKLFGATPAGLCQEWASETLRNQQRASTPLPEPDDGLQQPARTLAAPAPPPARAASKANPQPPVAQPVSAKLIRPAEAIRKTVAIQPVAIPARGPRAEAALPRAAVAPQPEQNRWDSAKVAIRIPFFRIWSVRKAEPEKVITAKAAVPTATADAASPRREEERSRQRPRPWQIPGRCTVENGPPQLAPRCNRAEWAQ